ncbi:hypothetical protein [Paenibacillus sp. JCM 10914]|nr:hypothetical protein [Paenibacillus sp. JCM 10914]
MNFDKLPIAEEIKQIHRENLKRRALEEGRLIGIQMVIDDVNEVSRGRFI